MIKRFLIPIMAVIALFFLIGAKKDLPLLDKNNITGEILWNRITKEDNFRIYAYWPDHKGMRPGKAPHGPYHKIFINDIIQNALPISNKIIPNGGIVVRESYDLDQAFDNISVMIKVKGYDPENNDWFWAQYGSDGKLISSGKIMECISCHKAFKNNDYLIIHKLDK